jgi:hypothetical protein
MAKLIVSETNPNDAVGGGGCIGQGDSKHEDCRGPYVVFHAVETDNNLSPHVVLCSVCLEEASARAHVAEPVRAGQGDEYREPVDEPAHVPASGPAGDPDHLERAPQPACTTDPATCEVCEDECVAVSDGKDGAPTESE